MSKTILFVTYGGGHVRMLIPVIDALKKFNRELEIKVLALPAAKSILEQHNVDCFTFLKYLKKSNDEANNWGKELAKEHHTPSSGIELEESIAYLGLNYQDLVDRFGKDAAKIKLQEKGRHAFFPVTVMEQVFEDVRPDFVIATNSPRSEAAAIEVANQRGIDNLIITDLFTGLIGYQLKARNISFLNKTALEQFEKDGLVDVSISQVHFTGNPAFDSLLAQSNDPISGWLDQIAPGIDKRLIVLHADMPAYWDPEQKRSHYRTDKEILEEMDAVYAAARANGAVYLIRPHPSQRRELYLRWLSGRPDAFLAAEQDLHELMRNISLLVVRTSTVGLEAAYMRKRVLQLDCDFHKDLPLAKMGVAWGVNSYGELTKEMEKALNDSEKMARISLTIEELLPSEPAAEKIARIVHEKITA